MGARLGVVADPIKVEPTDEWLNRLESFTVTLYDQQGRELATGRGSALMGNPLNVLLWLVESLKEQGKKLKRGDIVSVGSITPVVPVEGKGAIRAVYRGLSPDGDVELVVRFD